MLEVEPMTDNQESAFGHWQDGINLVLNGAAGTGKTYIGMAMAMEEVLDPDTSLKKMVILRSVVPTRDIGFLPGSEEEKIEVYAKPYIAIMDELFEGKNAWARGQYNKQVEFESTSFLRGQTWHDSVVIIDEMQNMSAHELDSVITRIGNNCRVIFSGDYYQSDFTKEKERGGILEFLKVLKQMKDFKTVEFSWNDIVRSGLVRDYIITKEMLLKKGEIKF